jgi:hypothetical protein
LPVVEINKDLILQVIIHFNIREIIIALPLLIRGCPGRLVILNFTADTIGCKTSGEPL